MEPLSVTASVVAVIGAARKLSRGVSLLKAAKDSPESLDDLLLHLSGIEEVLQAIQDVSTEPSTVLPGLTRVLDRAKAKFVEMESLIQYTLTEAGESSKVDRWQWLRKRGEVEKLQRQLDALRNDLTALITAQNL